LRRREVDRNGRSRALSNAGSGAAMTITLTLNPQTLTEGQTISGSSFVSSVTDSALRSITEYSVYDSGKDGGYFTLNGKKLSDGVWHTLTAAQFAELQYVAGSSAGSETISIKAYDGKSWSAAYSTKETTTAPSVSLSVTAASQTVTEGQTLAASSLIASTSAPSGESITTYALTDSGTDGTLYYNGSALIAGTTYDYTAAELAEVTWVAGSSVGSDQVSIEVSDGGAFSSAATATLTVDAPATSSVVSLLGKLGVSATVAEQLTANNSLSYNGMLTILQDAAVGGMTATKFSALQTLASMLNQSGGLTTSAYVQQIADDVIDGNSANAVWNGGSSTTTKLGNLSATSTQTQVDELIGKWFLGTDLPSLSVAAIGEQNLDPTYQTSTLPLFGSSGTPSYLDVSQGYLGDCYFVAALGETALQDPSLIEDMITSDGNGAYSVCFYINGQADYVTVNSQLPYMGGGYEWANGSTLEFANGTVDDWVALVEKAFAELNGQSAAANYGGHPTGNAYEDLSGGTAITLSEITDQTFNTYNLSPGESTPTLSSLMSTLSADFAAGDEVILSTPAADNGNLVGDHMYIVTGINLTAGTISIQNPWNTAYSSSLQMSFTDTIAQLAADSVSIYATTGTKVA